MCHGLGMETGECLNSESHTGNVNGQGASQTSPSEVD